MAIDVHTAKQEEYQCMSEHIEQKNFVFPTPKGSK